MLSWRENGLSEKKGNARKRQPGEEKGMKYCGSNMWLYSPGISTGNIEVDMPERAIVG